MADTPGTEDRIFTLDEIHEFAAMVSERDAKRAEGLTSDAGRALLAASRTVVAKDGTVITVSDGDVRDAILAIEAEASAHGDAQASLVRLDLATVRTAAEAVVTAHRQGVLKGDPTFWLTLDNLERALLDHPERLTPTAQYTEVETLQSRDVPPSDLHLRGRLRSEPIAKTGEGEPPIPTEEPDRERPGGGFGPWGPGW